MKKDPTDIAAMEKAISNKYGSETIANPKSTWDESKEKDYMEQVKLAAEKDSTSAESRDKIELNGFLLSGGISLTAIKTGMKMVQDDLENIINLLGESDNDAEKFDRGNSTAGTRVRKQVMEAIKLLKEIRAEIIETRNDRKNG